MNKIEVYVKPCAGRRPGFVDGDENMGWAKGKIITIVRDRIYEIGPDFMKYGEGYGWSWYSPFCVLITDENREHFKDIERCEYARDNRRQVV